MNRYIFIEPMGKRFTSFRERIQTWHVPRLLLNKYFFSFFVFVVWMMFFDQNNVFIQMRRLSDLHTSVSQTNYYVKETAKTREQLNKLKCDQRALEEYAREKYYMKKPNEDVFVIVDK